jgi:hypothetical protein
MTVIMGINLSDRVCLLADSRVSYLNKLTGETRFKDDDTLKIEQLESLRGCVIASAGDGDFAAFLIDALNRDFKDSTIVELRAQIYDWALRQGGIYGQIDNRAMVTFLITGVDESSKKVIDRDRFNEVLDVHFSGKSGVGVMRPSLLNATSSADPDSKQLVLADNDIKLFSIRIDLQSSVVIEDSKWGDVLLYGPSKVELEKISSEAIGRFEFDQVEGDLISLVQHDSTMLVAIAKSLIDEKSWETVGGALIPMHIYSNMKLATLPRKFYVSGLDGSNMRFVSGYHMAPGGKFYRLDENETLHRLYRVSDTKIKRRKQGKKGKFRDVSSLLIEL